MKMNWSKIKQYLQLFVLIVSLELLMTWFRSNDKSMLEQITSILVFIISLAIIYFLISKFGNFDFMKIFSYSGGMLVGVLSITSLVISSRLINRTAFIPVVDLFTIVVVGVLSGSSYVWYIRWMYKDSLEEDNQKHDEVL